MKHSKASGRQQGGALIEFALLLPLLLTIALGIVYYGYAFVLRLTVEKAADNAAQQVVAVSPLASNYSATVAARAQAAAVTTFSWLSAERAQRLVTVAVKSVGGTSSTSTCTGDGPQASVEVTLRPFEAGDRLLPVFVLGGFTIPPGLPTTISSRACFAL